jgi:uncharacterized protein YvpB
MEVGMAHVTRIDYEKGIIENELEGEIKAEEIIEIIKENAAIAQSNNLLYWINDFRKATYDIHTFEIFKFPEEMRKITLEYGECLARIRRAIISKGIDEKVKLAEIVNQNRGQRVMVFEDIDEAREWITGE